jgi:hypothetical protein
VLNGKANDSANISVYSAYRLYSVYSVFYSVNSVYSVINFNSANTLVYSVLLCVLNSFYSVYSVDIVMYSDLFKFLYSVLSSLVLLGELNGMLLDIMNWSRGRIVINSLGGYKCVSI